MPEVALPPTTPSTDHFTPVFVVPVTLAANCFVVPTVTTAEEGEMVTTTCAAANELAVSSNMRTDNVLRRVVNRAIKERFAETLVFIAHHRKKFWFGVSR